MSCLIHIICQVIRFSFKESKELNIAIFHNLPYKNKINVYNSPLISESISHSKLSKTCFAKSCKKINLLAILQQKLGKVG